MRLAGDSLIVIGHASGSMVIEGEYGSVGWLCDSVRDGSTVMQARERGNRRASCFLQIDMHEVGLGDGPWRAIGFGPKTKQN